MKSLIHFSVVALALSARLAAAPAAPEDLSIIDVSPKSFRVAWHTDPDTEPEISVFSNAAGNAPVNGLVITPYPLAPDDDFLRIESSVRGLLSIEATGLTPNTTYYFRVASRSQIDGTVTSAPLQSVRTAVQSGLVTHAAPLTAFANPVIRFQGVTTDGNTTDVSSIILASVAGARSPVAAVVGLGPVVLLDLNNLISEASGTVLPISGSEPLTLKIMRGNGQTETFSFFAPSGDPTAAIADPQLSDEPLASPVIRTHRHSDTLARVFMEFPADPDIFYKVETSETLDTGAWTESEAGLRGQNGRLFWEDNGLSGSPSPPGDTPKRFYRLVPLSP